MIVLLHPRLICLIRNLETVGGNNPIMKIILMHKIGFCHHFIGTHPSSLLVVVPLYEMRRAVILYLV